VPTKRGLGGIVERHRLGGVAIVEMDLAGALQRHHHQLRLAMAVPAAPLARRDMMQPEQALRLERQAFATSGS
jgi:hypothetical protein